MGKEKTREMRQTQTKGERQLRARRTNKARVRIAAVAVKRGASAHILPDEDERFKFVIEILL